MQILPEEMSLPLGVVDGRNIWENNFEASLKMTNNAVGHLGSERVMIAPSCSLLQCPYDLDLEANEGILTPEIKQWFFLLS